MKKALSLLFLFLLIVTLQSPSEAAGKVRVARTPIILNGAMMPDAATIDRLDTLLDRELNVPLNGVLGIVEYIPEAEATDALNSVITENQALLGYKFHYRDVIRAAAQKVEADVFVIPVITDYYEVITFGGWYWDTGRGLHTSTGLKLVVYDGRADRVYEKEGNRYYNSSYSLWGTAANLIVDCMYIAIDEAKIYEIINPTDKLTDMVDK